MNWYNQLYIGESIAKSAGKIKKKIKYGKLTLDIYIIAFASNPENLLDIIPANELLQKGYPKKRMNVIGLARGYEEALMVVTGIIEETYQKTGGVDVWNYLKEERRKQYGNSFSRS